MSEPQNPTPCPTPPTKLSSRELIERGWKGDESVSRELRQWVDRQDPAVLENLRGNMATNFKDVLIKKASGANLTKQHALDRQTQLMRDEIGGPNPTPIERMLAETASNCWLAYNYYQVAHDQWEGLTMLQSDFLLKRIQLAHRRFMETIKTLATVRKLAIPNLQVNLAHQQLNVAGNAQVVQSPWNVGGRKKPLE